MRLSQIRQLARLAGGFRNFARTPVSYAQAVSDIGQRLAERERNFVRLARQLIYDVPSSPYRRLLLWASCEYEDLRASVESRGLEKTLESLRDEGVYLSLEEFKSRAPVCRRGLAFETQESDFDSPFLMGERIEGGTSGSRAKSTRVPYDWDFIAEEAAHEMVLYTIHNLLDAPLALWFPLSQGFAGFHNLLMNLKLGRPPEKWFSHRAGSLLATPLETRLALECAFWGGKAAGLAVPRPAFADLSRADTVVRWMEAARKKCGRSVLRTYGSSAVRLAQTALAMGAELTGSVIFSGGEPLTERRRRFIESAGLEVYPRYVATESGLIAAACPYRSSADDMHFYSDRLALIQLDREPGMAGEPIKSLLFTALTLHAGKVLLNVELGDFGQLTTQRCGCAFGELRLDAHLSGVRSYDKLTVEGMTVLTAELDDVIGAAVEKAGGGPDSYQFWETQNVTGLSRLIIAVSPDVSHVDEQKLIEDILDQLQRRGPRTALAAHLWNQAATLQVIREQPRLSGGHKMLPLIRNQPQRFGKPTDVHPEPPPAGRA